MSEITRTFGEHVKIIEPDDRHRFHLGRHITREPVKGWRVHRSPDGKSILLEAVDA